MSIIFLFFIYSVYPVVYQFVNMNQSVANNQLDDVYYPTTTEDHEENAYITPKDSTYTLTQAIATYSTVYRIEKNMIIADDITRDCYLCVGNATQIAYALYLRINKD